MRVKFRHFEMYNVDYTVADLLNEAGYVIKSAEIRDTVNTSADKDALRDALLGNNTRNLKVRIYPQPILTNPHNRVIGDE